MGGCASTQQQVLDAASNNKLDKLRQLFANNRDLALVIDDIRDPSTKDGLNPLMLASRAGHLEVCRYLVGEIRANPGHHSPKTGWTSLHFACSFNHAPVVQYLLDQGADPLVLTRSVLGSSGGGGLTAMDCARMANQVAIVRLLERRLCVFSGYLGMRRSTKFQAGVGRFLGSLVKATLVDAMGGGETRDLWIVLTNAYSIPPGHKCPFCAGALHPLLAHELCCRHCGRDLARALLGGEAGAVSSSVVTQVRELAVYSSPMEAMPESTYSFDAGAATLPVQVDKPGNALIFPALRNPEVPAAASAGTLTVDLVKPSSKTSSSGAIWRQAALTRSSSGSQASSAKYKKLSFLLVQQQGRDAEAFLKAVRLPPARAVDLAKRAVAAPPRPAPPRPPPPMATLLVEEEEEVRGRHESWTCTACTLVNSSSSQCAACLRPRTAGQQQEADEDDDEVPRQFLCPLSGKVMEDPVMTCDGTSYERSIISAHLRRAADVAFLSPVTGLPLPSTRLVPNLSLKLAIEQWKAALPVASLVET